jgi:two-component system sensor histidine kinase UhpB
MAEEKGTILIVDDELTILELLFKYLRNVGFRVLTAKDGESAIRVTEQAKPDIILLDVMMPGIDGFETCCRLKADEESKEIPIIFMTALSDTADKVKGLEIGAVDYITKPTHIEEVLARINTHLGIRNLQKSLQEQIAERLRAEEALRESEAKYRTLVEQIPAVTYIAALDEISTTLYFSPQIEELLGFSQAEWLADPELFRKRLHPDDRERVMAELARSHASGEPFISEYRLLARDGSAVWFRDEAGVVRDDDGNSLFLQGVMLDITEHKRMEEALARSNAEKQRLAEAEAIAEERRRIAQEIHDGLIQNLAGLRFRFRHWHRLLDTDPAQMHAELDELQEILGASINEMRRSIFALRPTVLDEHGFFPTLRKFASDFGEHYRLRVKLQTCGPEERLPLSLELTLFRVIQEALHNVSKHAQAEAVWIALDLAATDAITLTIRDDGQGFDPASLGQAARRGHLGLKQMRERVENANGTLLIQSQPGGGTEVRAVLPLS